MTVMRRADYQTVMFFVHELGAPFAEARELAASLQARRVSLVTWLTEWQQMNIEEERARFEARQLRLVS